MRPDRSSGIKGFDHVDEAARPRQRSGARLQRVLRLELEAEGPEAHHVVGAQLLPLDLHVVDEGAVGAVEIADHVAAQLGRDLGVLPRHARVVEHDVVVRTAPDQAGRVEREAPTDEIAVDRDQPGHGSAPHLFQRVFERDR